MSKKDLDMIKDAIQEIVTGEKYDLESESLIVGQISHFMDIETLEKIMSTNSTN